MNFQGFLLVLFVLLLFFLGNNYLTQALLWSTLTWLALHTHQHSSHSSSSSSQSSIISSSEVSGSELDSEIMITLTLWAVVLTILSNLQPTTGESATHTIVNMVWLMPLFAPSPCSLPTWLLLEESEDSKWLSSASSEYFSTDGMNWWHGGTLFLTMVTLSDFSFSDLHSVSPQLGFSDSRIKLPPPALLDTLPADTPEHTALSEPASSGSSYPSYHASEPFMM